MEQKNTFPKEEKLKSKKAIETLFNEGQSVDNFPVRAIFLQKKTTTEQSVIKVAVSVPKKKIKLAVNRNLLKRRIREAYRLNKHSFKLSMEEKQISMDVMFIYVSKQICSYKEIEEKIKVTLKRLNELSGLHSE